MNEPIIAQTNIPEGFIDLGMGNPGYELLPLEMLRQSAKAHLESGDARSLQYGLEQGDGFFRLALAAFLTKAYGSPVDPDLLFVTAGASSALDLLCTLYTKPNDVIFVEEPSYFLALRIFGDHGLRVIAIPIDADGMRIDALDKKLTEFQPKFIYTVPTFQNPSGRTLSKTRREDLLERAQQCGFLVLADEVYHFLHYSQVPPSAFANYVEEVEQVVSVNSFSKILAPGLRLGWIQAHGEVIRKLAGSGLLESGGGLNPFMSALVRGLIESGGLVRKISSLRREYATRLQAMDEALREHLLVSEYDLPKGGFFFWVRLPGVDAATLRSKAMEYKVDFRPGYLFSSQKGMKDMVRLGFCFYRPVDIEEGVKRLGRCLDS
jgi:DNA-binding transcriptional MocR family regulator